MEPVKLISGRVVPLLRKDIDTDMIIPAQHLTQTSRTGYGRFLFERLRNSESDFPLNQSQYQDASIMLGGANFGCGSSREHAVWALMDAGFKAIISESFADIFFSNSAKNGLLLIQLPSKDIERLAKLIERGALELRIDLPEQTVTLPEGSTLSFEYDPFRKHCLINGLDELDYLLSKQSEIRTYFEQDSRSEFTARRLTWRSSSIK